jgi:hypothetical protein
MLDPKSVSELMRQLDTLEKSVRWWKRLALACVVAVPTLLFAVPAFHPEPWLQKSCAAEPAEKKFAYDSTSAQTTYTNFCHVIFTPEEIFLDFGLNTQTDPQGAQPEPIKITNRIVMNFYTAKRLSRSLTYAVDRHEKTFGELELDYKKRVRQKKD